MGNCLRTSKVTGTVHLVHPAKTEEPKTEGIIPSIESTPTIEQSPEKAKKPMSRIAMMKAEMKKKQALSNQSGNHELYQYLLEIAQEPASTHPADVSAVALRISNEPLLRTSILQKDFTGLTVIDYCLNNDQIPLFRFLIDRLDLSNPESSSNDFISQLSQTVFKAQLVASKQFNRNPQPFFDFIDFIEESVNLGLLFQNYTQSSTNIASFLQFIDLYQKPAQELIARMTSIVKKSIEVKREQKEVDFLESIATIQKKIKYEQYFKHFSFPEDVSELEEDISNGFLELSLPNIKFNMNHTKSETKSLLKSQTYSYTLAHHIALHNKFDLFTNRLNAFKSQLFARDSSESSAATRIMSKAPLKLIEQLLQFCFEQDNDYQKQLLSITDNTHNNIIHFLLKNPLVQPDSIPALVDTITKNDSSIKENLLEGYDNQQLIPLSFYLRQNINSATLSISLVKYLTPRGIMEDINKLLQDNYADDEALKIPLWETPFIQMALFPTYVWSLYPQLSRFYERVLALNNNVFESIQQIANTSKDNEYLKTVQQRLNLALIPNCLQICFTLNDRNLIEKCIRDQINLDSQRFSVLTYDVLKDTSSISEALTFLKLINKQSTPDSSLFTQKVILKLNNMILSSYKIDSSKNSPADFIQPPTAFDSLITLAVNNFSKKQLESSSSDSKALQKYIDTQLLQVFKEQSSKHEQFIKVRSSLRMPLSSTAFHTMCKIYAYENVDLIAELTLILNKLNESIESILKPDNYDIREEAILLNITHPDFISADKFFSSYDDKSFLNQIQLLSALRKNYLCLNSLNISILIVKKIGFSVYLEGLKRSTRELFLNNFVTQLLLATKDNKQHIKDILGHTTEREQSLQKEFSDQIVPYLLETLISVIKKQGFSFAYDFLTQLPIDIKLRILPRILIAVPAIEKEHQTQFKKLLTIQQEEYDKTQFFIVNLSKQFDSNFYVSNAKFLLQSLINCDLIGSKQLKLVLPPLKLELTSKLIKSLDTSPSVYVQFFADLITKSCTPIQLLMQNEKYSPILQSITSLDDLPLTKTSLCKNIKIAVNHINAPAVQFIFSLITPSEETFEFYELGVDSCSAPLLADKVSSKNSPSISAHEIKSRATIFTVIQSHFPEDCNFSRQFYQFFGSYVDAKAIKASPKSFSIDFIQTLSIVQDILLRGSQVSRSRTQVAFAPFSDEVLTLILEESLTAINLILDKEVIAFKKQNPRQLQNESEIYASFSYRSVFRNLKLFSHLFVESSSLQNQLLEICCKFAILYNIEAAEHLIPMIIAIIKSHSPIAVKFIQQFVMPIFAIRIYNEYIVNNTSEELHSNPDFELEITRMMEAASRASNETVALNILTLVSLLYFSDPKQETKQTKREYDYKQKKIQPKFSAKISRRIGQPKPDVFDAIITTFEDHRVTPLSKYLTDEQFKIVLGSLSALHKVCQEEILLEFRQKLEDRFKIVMAGCIQNVAQLGQIFKWRNIFEQSDIVGTSSETKVHQNDFFIAAVKSLSNLVLTLPNKDTSEEIFLHNKMYAIISTKLLQVQSCTALSTNATPDAEVVNREDFIQIFEFSIFMLNRLSDKNKLKSILEEQEQDIEDCYNAGILAAIVETIRGCFLFEFDLSLTLAKCLLASKTKLSQKFCIYLTYSTLQYGPLFAGSLWTPENFREYLDVFGEMYLQVLKYGIDGKEGTNQSRTFGVYNYITIGGFVELLYSQSTELNQIYIQFLLDNISQLTENQVHVLNHIIFWSCLRSFAAGDGDQHSSKIYLLDAMHTQGLTFSSILYSQIFADSRLKETLHDYEEHNALLNSHEISKLIDPTFEQGYTDEFFEVLSAHSIKYAYDKKLFTFDLLVELKRRQAKKYQYLKLESKEEKIPIARYIVLQGKYGVVTQMFEEIMSSFGEENRSATIEMLTRDSLFSGRIELFQFFFEEQLVRDCLNDASVEARQFAFIEKHQILFELIKHQVGNELIYSYLLTKCYFVPQYKLSIQHVIAHNGQMLRGLINMHYQDTIVEILMRVIKNGSANDKIELRSTLIRQPESEDNAKDVENADTNEVHEEEKKEEIGGDKLQLSIADMLYHLRFYETLCLLEENGIQDITPSNEVENIIEDSLRSNYHNTQLSDVDTTRCKLFGYIFELFVFVRDQLTNLATSFETIAQLEELLFQFYKVSPSSRQSSILMNLLETFIGQQFLGGIYILAELFPQIDVPELINKNKKLQRSEMLNIYLLKRTVYPDIDFIALNSKSEKQNNNNQQIACSMSSFLQEFNEKNLQEALTYMKKYSPDVDASNKYSQDSKEAILKRFVTNAYYQKEFISIIGQKDKQFLLHDDDILTNIVLQDPKLAISLLKNDEQEQTYILNKFRSQLKQNFDEFVEMNPRNNEPNADEIDQEKKGGIIHMNPYVQANDSPFNKVLRAILYYFDVRSNNVFQLQEVFANIFSDIQVLTKQGISFQYHLKILSAVGFSDESSPENLTINSQIIEDLTLNHILPRVFNPHAAHNSSANPTIEFSEVFLSIASIANAKANSHRRCSVVFETIFTIFQSLHSLQLLEGNEDKSLSIRLIQGGAPIKITLFTDEGIHIDVCYDINSENQFNLYTQDISAAQKEINTYYFVHKHLPQIMQQIEHFDVQKNTLIPPEILGNINLEFDYDSIDHLPLEEKELILAQTNFMPSKLKQKKTKHAYSYNNFDPLVYDSNLYFGLYSLFQEISASIGFLTEIPGEFYSINDMFAPNNSATMNPSEQQHPQLSLQQSNSQNQSRMSEQNTAAMNQKVVLDKAKMQGAIIQYYLEQLPDNTYKLRPQRSKSIHQKQQQQELFFSEFYMFTPLQAGKMEIVYLPPEEFAARTSPIAVYDTILSQLYNYEQNFIEQLRIAQQDNNITESLLIQKSAHKWFYTIKVTPDDNKDIQSHHKNGRIVWANEIFVGYNILHIKQMLRYFQREVEFGKPPTDSLNQNWKLNCVSLFEVVLSAMTRIARASERSTCEKFGFDSDSIFGILKHVLSSPILFKLIRVILYNNLSNAGNITKVIKGFYFEFSEIDASELPSATSDPELAQYLEHGLDQCIRFGRTEYYIQKHMLVIRLNVAFILESMDGLEFKSSSQNENDSEVLTNYIKTAANAFDFYEQLFSSEQIVCQILNKLEIDNRMLQVSKDLSNKYSQSITLNINYESLFALFKAEIASAKLIIDPIEQISKYETVWKGLESIRNYFMNDFDRIIHRQLGKQSFQDMFSTIFINLIYAYENKQRIFKRLYSNFRSHKVLSPVNNKIENQVNNQNNSEQEDHDDNDDEQILSQVSFDSLAGRGQSKDARLIDTLIALDGACSKFENTFLIQMNLSDFIQQAKQGDDCLIGYSSKNNEYCYKFGTVSKKSNISITLGHIYQGSFDSQYEIQFDKISFVMKNFKNWPNPHIFKSEIIRYAIIDSALRIKLIHSRAIQDICNFFMLDNTERDVSLEQEYDGYLFRGSESISSEISLNNLIQLMPSTIGLYFESEDSSAQGIMSESLSLLKQRSTLQQQQTSSLNEQKVVFKLNNLLKFKNPEIYPGQLSFASQIDSNMFIYEEQLNLVSSLQLMFTQYLYSQTHQESLRIEFEYDSAYEESRYQYMEQFQKNITLICSNISDGFCKYIESPELSDELEKSLQLHSHTNTAHLFFNELNVTRFLITKIFLKHVEIIQIKFSDFPSQSSNSNLQFMTYDPELKSLYIHIFIGKTDNEIIIPSIKDIHFALNKQIVLCELSYLSNSKFQKLDSSNDSYIVNSKMQEYLNITSCTIADSQSEYNNLDSIQVYENILLNLATLEFILTQIYINSVLKHAIQGQAQIAVTLNKNNASPSVLFDTSSSTVGILKISLGLLGDQFYNHSDIEIELKDESLNSFLPSSYIDISNVTVTKESSRLQIYQRLRLLDQIQDENEILLNLPSYKVSFIDLNSYQVISSAVQSVHFEDESVKLSVESPAGMLRYKYVVEFKNQVISSNFCVSESHECVSTIQAQPSNLSFLINQKVSFLAQAQNPHHILTNSNDSKKTRSASSKYEGINLSIYMKEYDVGISLKTYAMRYQEYILNQNSLSLAKSIVKKMPLGQSNNNNNNNNSNHQTSYRATFNIRSKYISKDTILVTLVNPRAQNIVVKNADAALIYAGGVSSKTEDGGIQVQFFTNSKICISKSQLLGTMDQNNELQQFNVKKQKKNEWVDSDLALKKVFQSLQIQQSRLQVRLESWTLIKSEQDLKNISDLQNQIKFQEGQHVFFSRAGEKRREIIQFSDSFGNLMELTDEQLSSYEIVLCNSVFSQIAFQAKIYKKQDFQYFIEWLPLVKGSYKLYFNGYYVPNSEDHIGVIANVIDFDSIRVEHSLPAIVPYFEQIECQIYLKDRYGNIYSDFDKTRSKDKCLLTVVDSVIMEDAEFISKLSQINKDGKQSILMSFESQTIGANQAVQKKATIILLYDGKQLDSIHLTVSGLNFEKRKKIFYESVSKFKKNHLSQTIEINRDRFAEDLLLTFEKFDLKSQMYIVFKGERGVDAGGLKREFYELVGKMMKDNNYKFFETIRQETSEKIFFHPQCLKSKQSLAYFTIFGKFLANSILHQQLLGVDFCEPVYKLLAKQEIVFSDLKSVIDKSTYDNYCYLLTLDEESLIDMCQYFQVTENGKLVNLVPNGEKKQVDISNLKEFLDLIAKHHIQERFQAAVNSLIEGFESVFPVDSLVKIILPHEISYLTCGVKEITGALLQKMTKFEGGNSILINFFQRYLVESSSEMLSNFLKFISGSSSIPYEHSQIMLRVQFMPQMASNRLPLSHTCFLSIEVPYYKTYEQMKIKFDLAFALGNEGFAFG